MIHSPRVGQFFALNNMKVGSAKLVQQMKTLTMTTDEEILLNLAVEHVADALAGKLDRPR